MDCRHLDDYYELYVLGAASPDLTEEISLHLSRECPRCVARLREATLNTYFLSTLARPSRLNPKARARLLARLKKK